MPHLTSPDGNEIDPKSAIPWTETTARTFLAEAFSALFDPRNDPQETAAKYMTADYIQHVDGKSLDFAGFVEHLQVLHDSLERIDFTFETVVVSGNTISDIHIVDAVKNDGSTIRTKVIAFFFMRDGMIRKIDELTHMMEGSEEDRDMGSRQTAGSAEVRAPEE